MADYVWLYTYFHHHHRHHPNTGGKFASDKKRIRESLCLYLGRSQYMSGDYYYEFGGMSKRRCFSRLGTNREQQGRRRRRRRRLAITNPSLVASIPKSSAIPSMPSNQTASSKLALLSSRRMRSTYRVLQERP